MSSQGASNPDKTLKNPQSHPLPNHPMIPDDTDLGIYSQETRFTTDDETFVRELQAKLSKLSKPRVYHTYTFYMDKDKGGWMDGTSQVKYRLRNYNGLPEWYLEQKAHVGNKTFKRRVKFVLDMKDPQAFQKLLIKLRPLKPQFASRYVRTEYEFKGLRVTIDRHLEAVDKHEDVQDVYSGHYIIELKRSPNVPEWLMAALRKYRDPKFSKSSWIRKKLGLKK